MAGTSISETPLDGLDNEELALKAKGGDREARNALFFRHQEQIKRQCAWAKRKIHGQEDAPLDPEDIDQQAFIAFCELIESWQPSRTPFAAYLGSTLHWRMLHYVRGALRYRSRHTLVHLHLAEQEAQQPDAASEAAFQQVENETAWEGYLDLLAASLKLPVSLRFYHNLSSREIAQAAGVSRRTVDRELQSALSTLRSCLEEEQETL